MFSLTASEKTELVTTCDQFTRLKHSSSLTNAFIGHGALMLASVLNSQKAVDTSIYVIRAFVRLRALLATNENLMQKLAELEMKTAKHDSDILNIVRAMRQLTESHASQPTRKIGFAVDEPAHQYKAGRNQESES